MNYHSKNFNVYDKDFKQMIHGLLNSYKYKEIRDIELDINGNKLQDPFILYVFGTNRLQLNELEEAEFF